MHAQGTPHGGHKNDMTTQPSSTRVQSAEDRADTFSQRLKQLRAGRGWSQERLAQELDTGPSTIKNWESGRSLPQPIYRERLMALFCLDAQALGLIHVEAVPMAREEPPDVVEAQVQPREKTRHRKQGEMDGVTRSFPQFLYSPQRGFGFALLVLVSVILLGSIFVLFMHVPMHTPVSQSVGSFAFQSSNLFRDGNNGGMNDTVHIEMTNVPSPQAGKHYYAWLEPADREQPSIALGMLQVQGDRAFLSYAGGSDHRNLLDVATRLVVTEQDSASATLGPSMSMHDQRYKAEFPNMHPTPASSDTLSQEYSHYGLLDHLRHLLSSDPTLLKRGLSGGLVHWLDLQTNLVVFWARQAHDAIETRSPQAASIRDPLIRMLNVLDSTAIIDSPPVPILVDRTPASFALLPRTDQVNQDSYIAHIDLHLRGVQASPGATPQMRVLSAKLDSELVEIMDQLRVVRADVTRLLHMDTLTSDEAVTLLESAFLHANTAYAGPVGVFGFVLALEAFPVMPIVSCTLIDCSR